MESKETVYISGPITGVTDYMEHFEEAEKRLTAAGYEVVNPARINAGLPISTTYTGYMHVSLALLSICDRIFFLRNWQNSKGARLEFEYANVNDIRILYEMDLEQREEDIKAV